MRFYIRKGLLTPETGLKGGSKPYQMFSAAQVETARMIRVAQSLGFSLKEIGVMADEFRNNALTPARGSAVLRDQLEKLDQKAAQLANMIAYMRAKLVWIEERHGPEPRFDDFAQGGV